MSKMDIEVAFDSRFLNFEHATTWARKNCQSFVISGSRNRRIQCSSITSYAWVIEYVFYFSNENEALLFQLRWA